MTRRAIFFMKRLHRPVLLTQVIENMNVFSGGVYADLTFGEGGHSEKILESGAGKLVGLDRDTRAIRQYSEQGLFRADSRFSLIHGRISNFPDLSPCDAYDGILVDLGVSTRQLLEAERGFSLAEAGPLDMRMNSETGDSLLEILENLSAEELADAIYKNVELKDSRALARRILYKLEKGELKTTLDLAHLAGPKIPGKSHPATALFTGLRMIVNEELKEIEAGIPPLLKLLKPGGRLAVISFHSTEDRVVKRMMNNMAGKCICEEMICRCPRVAQVKLITKKPIEADDEELKANPRARSAKLRCIEKI